MKIKLKRNVAGHNAGDTIDVTTAGAKHLTESGHAQAADEAPKQADKAPAKRVGGTPGRKTARTAG